MQITGWVHELSHSHSTNIGILPGTALEDGPLSCFNISQGQKGKRRNSQRIEVTDPFVDTSEGAVY